MHNLCNYYNYVSLLRLMIIVTARAYVTSTTKTSTVFLLGWRDEEGKEEVSLMAHAALTDGHAINVPTLKYSGHR